MFVDGCKFYREKVANGKVYWRCSLKRKSKCGVRVITRGDDILNVIGQHIHSIGFHNDELNDKDGKLTSIRDTVQKKYDTLQRTDDNLHANSRDIPSILEENDDEESWFNEFMEDDADAATENTSNLSNESENETASEAEDDDDDDDDNDSLRLTESFRIMHAGSRDPNDLVNRLRLLASTPDANRVKEMNNIINYLRAAKIIM